MPAKIDWTGIKLHKLMFIRPTNIRRCGIMWEAQCDCGVITIVRPIDVKIGKHKSCGCYIRGGAGRRKYEPIETSARKIWDCNYKDGGISFEYFLSLSKQNCYYCAREPSYTYNRIEKNSSKNQIRNGAFTYNGLDRVDSNLEHTQDNVVPCCFLCNGAKSDIVQKEFFLNIERQYYHMISIRKNGIKIHTPNHIDFPIPTLDRHILGANPRRRTHHPIMSSAAKVWWPYKD